jgi:hypothetical protein
MRFIVRSPSLAALSVTSPTIIASATAAVVPPTINNSFFIHRTTYRTSAMTQFPDLPTELRHNILEHVITAYTYLDPPDVDAQRPEEWFCPKPTYPPGRNGGYPPVAPIIRHFRRVPASTVLGAGPLAHCVYDPDAHFSEHCRVPDRRLHHCQNIEGHIRCSAG